MKHIGIVACSAERAALCYRTICETGAKWLGGHEHPEVTMHTPSFERYGELLNAGDWSGVADLMVASASKLADAGADFLVCPDNTIHQALPSGERAGSSIVTSIREARRERHRIPAPAAYGTRRPGRPTRGGIRQVPYPGALHEKGDR